MPIILERKSGVSQLWVWEQTESLAALQNALPKILQTKMPQQAQAALAYCSSRVLLQEVFGQSALLSLKKDAAGRPFLLNKVISISHCKGFSALTIGGPRPGLDVEGPRGPQLIRIAEKFILPAKLQALRKGPNYEEALANIWSAKETLFKAMGGGGIDFREHLAVDYPLEEVQLPSRFSARYHGPKGQVEFALEALPLPNQHRLIWCI